jgi:glutathione S-transferase kappa 1
MGKKTVELFYDVLSPYSWFAFEFLCRARNRWNIDVKFRPVSLAEIVVEAGNRLPWIVPRKHTYLTNDLHHLGDFYQVPLNAVEDVRDTMLNKGSLFAQRLLTSVSMTQPELLESLSRELWMRIWSRRQDISTIDNILEALKAIGVPDERAKELILSIEDKKVDERLKEVTAEAMSYGAFGAPTIVTTDAKNEKRMFFGSDRMELLAFVLGEKYEGPLRELAAWKL